MDYLKTPQEIVLTQADAFNDTQDNSMVLEFDDVSAEQIRQYTVIKYLERTNDAARLVT
jgi:hypothetical protein